MIARSLTVIAAACFSLASFGALSGAAAQDLLSAGEPVKTRTKLIDTFHIGHQNRVFGPLTFLGGFELLASDRKIGGLSGLISLDQGSRFLAVTDKGHWVSGEIEQKADGTPAGIQNVRFAPMRDAKGRTMLSQRRHDAEALTLSPSGLYVAIERKHAIYRYPWPMKTGEERLVGQVALPDSVRKLRRNAGLESLAAAPKDNPLAGNLIAIAETAPSDAHNLSGYILGPQGTQRFFIHHHDGFDATDAAFLPDGDLLLLERRFNLRDLIGMRLRRFSASTLKPEAVLEGEVLLEADFNYQIDNMEALAVHQNAAGDTILTLVSDNNRSLLQRTLFLRFRLD